MFGLPTPTAQNVRLIIVLALSALAVATTVANAADDSPVEDAAPPTSSVPPTSSSLPGLDPDATSSSPPTASDPAELSAPSAPSSAIGIVSIPSTAADSVMASGPPTNEPVETGCALLASEQRGDIESAPSTDEVFEDSFDGSADAWDPLSGSWSVDDGTYRQADPSGYDLITQLRVEPPSQFRISVSLQALTEDLGGGVILAQPRPSDRSGAVVVDFTDGGSFLRWGRYDGETGQYGYIGGVAMVESFDPAARHDLTVEVRRERTTVFVDGLDVGGFEAIGPGRIGLVTSRSAVAFDDLTLVEVMG